MRKREIMWAAASLLQVLCFLIAGATSQADNSDTDGVQLTGYAARMQPVEDPALRDPQPSPEMHADAQLQLTPEPSPPPAAPLPGFAERLAHHAPDPELAVQQAYALLQDPETEIEATTLRAFIERVRRIDRPQDLQLTLQDALRRMLENNYGIRVSSYDPAIEVTRVVEAEAAFDAVLFANITNNKVDQPTPNALVASQEQIFSAQSGIRKLLPSGMQVEANYTTTRSFRNFQFQTLNPVWFDTFVVQFRQPLLRGFGLDYNRSQIRLSKLGWRRANQLYRRQVRDTLRETEEAYWRLVQARRTLVISARLLASFEQIYRFLDARKEFDVYRIQLADTKARLESNKADFIQRIVDVRNAEDRLISLMNDNEIDLADDIEIIPVDLPPYMPVLLDRVGEVQTALEHRSEIIEAKLGIDSAKVQVGVAKNQAMPRLDVTFRYSVDGLGPSQGDAFDEVTKHDFTEYFIGVEFELPVGNRARRAALQRAKLQYAQSLAALKQTFEQVILDVNISVRAVQAGYDQIEPSLLSAEASEDQVESIQERAEKKDFLTLNNELNARQSLAQARGNLVAAIVDYGIALMDLERSKGTLLRYNNIDLVFDAEAADPTE